MPTRTSSVNRSRRAASPEGKIKKLVARHEGKFVAVNSKGRVVAIGEDIPEAVRLAGSKKVRFPMVFRLSKHIAPPR